VLYALLQPVALIGLLTGYLLAVFIRAAVQHILAGRGPMAMRRQPPLDPRRDIDPYGALGALLGGTGWGRRAPESANGRARC
jgi:hypothetical protein